MSSSRMMPTILRVTGWTRALIALLGLGTMISSMMAPSPSLSIAVLLVQGVLILTALGGGVGWILLKDWGRKLLFVPSFFGIAQALTISTQATSLPVKSLIFLGLSTLVSLVCLVLIFLPAARCEKPSWEDSINPKIFRAMGGIHVAAACLLGLLLAWNAQTLEGLANAVFVAPTAFLALIGGLLMVFLKPTGRILLIGLWGLHAVLAATGPLLSRILSLEAWEVALNSSVSVALHDFDLRMPVANLVLLVTTLLLILAWLPSPPAKQ